VEGRTDGISRCFAAYKGERVELLRARSGGGVRDVLQTAAVH
jgi:hypothetical protein